MDISEKKSSRGSAALAEPETKKELLTINEASIILGVHQQTLRNWERKKLVVPLRVGARRVYTREHIDCCLRIKEFSGKGISLKGVRELLKNIGC